MAKKKYRIYKAGGQQGRVMNPTAQFLARAQTGMQQPSQEEMQMMQMQQQQEQLMQLMQMYAQLSASSPEDVEAIYAQVVQAFQEAAPEQQQQMIQEMSQAVEQAQGQPSQEDMAVMQQEEQVPMAKAGYVKMRVKEMKEGGTTDELAAKPTINDTPDGRGALVSEFNEGLKDSVLQSKAEKEYEDLAAAGNLPMIPLAQKGGSRRRLRNLTDRRVARIADRRSDMYDRSDRRALRQGLRAGDFTYDDVLAGQNVLGKPGYPQIEYPTSPITDQDEWDILESIYRAEEWNKAQPEVEEVEAKEEVSKNVKRPKGDPYEYKKENGKIFTRKKDSNEWIEVDPQSKAGEAIEKKVYKKKSDSKPKSDSKDSDTVSPKLETHITWLSDAYPPGEHESELGYNQRVHDKNVGASDKYWDGEKFALDPNPDPGNPNMMQLADGSWIDNSPLTPEEQKAYDQYLFNKIFLGPGGSLSQSSGRVDMLPGLWGVAALGPGSLAGGFAPAAAGAGERLLLNQGSRLLNPGQKLIQQGATKFLDAGQKLLGSPGAQLRLFLEGGPHDQEPFDYTVTANPTLGATDLEGSSFNPMYTMPAAYASGTKTGISEGRQQLWNMRRANPLSEEEGKIVDQYQAMAQETLQFGGARRRANRRLRRAMRRIPTAYGMGAYGVPTSGVNVIAPYGIASSEGMQEGVDPNMQMFPGNIHMSVKRGLFGRPKKWEMDISGIPFGAMAPFMGGMFGQGYPGYYQSGITYKDPVIINAKENNKEEVDKVDKNIEKPEKPESLKPYAWRDTEGKGYEKSDYLKKWDQELLESGTKVSSGYLGDAEKKLEEFGITLGKNEKEKDWIDKLKPYAIPATVAYLLYRKFRGKSIIPTLVSMQPTIGPTALGTGKGPSSVNRENYKQVHPRKTVKPGSGGPKGVSKSKGVVSKVKGTASKVGKWFKRLPGNVPIIAPLTGIITGEPESGTDPFYELYKPSSGVPVAGGTLSLQPGGIVDSNDPMYGNPDLYKFISGGIDQADIDYFNSKDVTDPYMAQDGLEVYQDKGEVNPLSEYESWKDKSAESKALAEYNRYMNRTDDPNYSTMMKYAPNTNDPVYNKILQGYQSPGQPSQGETVSEHMARTLGNPGYAPDNRVWDGSKWGRASSLTAAGGLCTNPNDPRCFPTRGRQGYYPTQGFPMPAVGYPGMYPGMYGGYGRGRTSSSPMGMLAGSIFGQPWGMAGRPKIYNRRGSYWEQTGFPGMAVDPSNISSIHTKGRQGLFGPRGRMDIFFGGPGQSGTAETSGSAETSSTTDATKDASMSNRQFARKYGTKGLGLGSTREMRRALRKGDMTQEEYLKAMSDDPASSASEWSMPDPNNPFGVPQADSYDPTEMSIEDQELFRQGKFDAQGNVIIPDTPILDEPQVYPPPPPGSVSRMPIQPAGRVGQPSRGVPQIIKPQPGDPRYAESIGMKPGPRYGPFNSSMLENRSMVSNYEEGGVYDLSTAEIGAIMAAGGIVEFV